MGQYYPKGKRKDFSGKRFGSLVVTRYVDTKCKVSRWACDCDCGKKTVALSNWLQAARHPTCGNCEDTRGLSTTPECFAWRAMLYRCNNPDSPDYPRYGGRGIKVAPPWESSFTTFLADMGKRPSNRHSLDRIDNNGNYEPGNCRWATATKQSNNRSNNVKLTYNGKTLTMAEWATLLGLPDQLLRGRKQAGWTTEEMLTTPKGCRRGEKKMPPH